MKECKERTNRKIVLTVDEEKLLREKYPDTSNGEIAEMLGICATTVRKIANELGLVKDVATVNRISQLKRKQTMETNGTWDSWRGKTPVCLKAYRSKYGSRNPMSIIKERDNEAYKEVMKSIGETRKAICSKEKLRMKYGLPRKTKYKLMLYPYTKRQTSLRYRAYLKGYLIGSADESGGDRYVIYYDDETRRSPRLEAYARSIGFEIKEDR